MQKVLFPITESGLVSLEDTTNQQFSRRHALFLIHSEERLLSLIDDAFVSLYDEPPEVVCFDDEGYLVARVQKKLFLEE